jgi:predicted RNase H-like HicB family nuclease
MRRRTYFGVIEAGEDGYGIYFPDFPGCVSGGDDLEHLVAMGHEALQFHIKGMVEDGDAIPDPMLPDLDRERAETPEADLRSLIAIEVDLPDYPASIDVAVDRVLVQEIDLLKANRRQFIMDATRRELERLKKTA